MDRPGRWLAGADRLRQESVELRGGDPAAAAVCQHDGLDERLGFVVNRAARAEIVPSDVARVFGRSPLAVIPEDRVVSSLQDRGRLLPANSRIGRMFARLADQVVETADVA